jgi:hypothetical protein
MKAPEDQAMILMQRLLAHLRIVLCIETSMGGYR